MSVINIKSGFVAVIGEPNAGKSTLINSLLNEPLLITSSKRQTTRQHVRCIVTGDDYQLILVDTPGMHQPKNRLGQYMQKEIHSTLANSDVVLYLLDATRPNPDLADYNIHKPIILALNKIDLLEQQQAGALVEELSADPRFKAVIPVSGLLGRNLDTLVEVIKEYLPAGDFLYPQDQLLDADYRFLAAEIIREQALVLLADEVPHGIAVEIDDFREEDSEARIAATINVERDSHKGIVIGQGGQMLKKIGRGARLEIKDLLGKNVHLRLWVKVRKNWRKDSNQLRWLGYK